MAEHVFHGRGPAVRRKGAVYRPRY
jgi:hypothetical protein